MIITNFTQSIIRAGIMSIISILSNLFYRKQDSITSISISMLISLIFNTFAVYDIGFQLSYLGTLGIILFNETIKNLLFKVINKNLAKMLAITISAQIFIIPISAYIFNNISFTFFISNLFATPILGAIMIFGFITIIISFISFKLAKLLAVVLNILIKLLVLIANLCSKIPFSSILIVTPYLFSIIIVYCLALLLRYLYLICNSKKSLQKIERKFIKIITSKELFKISLIIIIIIIIVNLFYSKIPKDLKIYFVDVMQGDCTLIITPNNKKILIDGGEDENDILVPYLLDRRIKKIDYIIISHFDSDHIRSDY